MKTLSLFSIPNNLLDLILTLFVPSYTFVNVVNSDIKYFGVILIIIEEIDIKLLYLYWILSKYVFDFVIDDILSCPVYWLILIPLILFNKLNIPYFGLYIGILVDPEIPYILLYCVYARYGIINPDKVVYELISLIE